jgi:hypothetical protein
VKEFLEILLFIGIWILFSRYLLPKMGVPT